ncbi:MAG: DUF2490 domain-containing protein [Flavobacteriales bacterium]|nr:DUF2490 domain-containing protein [Flavobacteriales bacterium]MCB9167165.1 DUF2490 domain-containing protein [Flavobacteriales bacterium]
MLLTGLLNAQVNRHQLGAWYMGFWRLGFGEGRWGAQGDVQFRNWDAGADLEQLLLRGGVTYSPKNVQATLTLGYAYILSGAPGESTATTNESRVYQEALLPHHPGWRLFLTHRFRLEERFVQHQDFRTRVRYALFLNAPLNRPKVGPGAVYLALYDELFINGERGIGEGRTVSLFDRNRAYGALGYALNDHLRLQAGAMLQSTDAWTKPQLQLSLHARY